MKLIDQYFEAFRSKNITAISDLLSSDVTLQDPIVRKLSGKPTVLLVYEEIFNSSKQISAEIVRCYQCGDSDYAVEFSLTFIDLEDKKAQVDGVDCIRIENGKITAIRAYLDVNP